MPKVIWFESNTHSSEKDLKLIGPLIECRVPVDRTDTLNEFKWDYEPIPKDFSDAKSWDDCCFSRAEELWRMNKPITVLWSGGIDSSTVFLALRETMPSDGELHVRYSQHSIDEFPSMYDAVKEFSEPCLKSSVEYFNKDFLKQDHMFVSGEPADMIFGTSTFFEKYADMMTEPWDALLYLEDFHPYDLDHKDRYRVACLVEQHMEKSPIEINNIFDVYWWLSFCFKYTQVDRIMFCSFFLSDVSDMHKNYSFFNTVDFQKWSMCFHDLKHQNTRMTHKQPAKDFIYKFTRDKNYQTYKTQEPSVFKHFDSSWISSRFKSKDKLKLLLDDGRFWRLEDSITEDVLNECRK